MNIHVLHQTSKCRFGYRPLVNRYACIASNLKVSIWVQAFSEHTFTFSICVKTVDLATGCSQFLLKTVDLVIGLCFFLDFYIKNHQKLSIWVQGRKLSIWLCGANTTIVLYSFTCTLCAVIRVKSSTHNFLTIFSQCESQCEQNSAHIVTHNIR